jgi:hypothetical protein
MLGMGDNIYQRPALKALAAERGDVYIRTTWPQFYRDMPNVHPVYADTGLRTQRANALSSDEFVTCPPKLEKLVCRYKISDFRRGIVPPDAMAKSLGVSIANESFELPWERNDMGRVGIIRPPTVRSEWTNSARPNDAVHMQRLIDNHPEITWISLGWIKPGEEWYYGEPLRVDEEYMLGQLSIDAMITMIASAEIMVTCVGFGLPLGIALRQRTLTMYGGDVPARLLRNEWMDLTHHREVEPNPFCDCYGSRHMGGECNKRLDDEEIERKYEELMHAAVA